MNWYVYIMIFLLFGCSNEETNEISTEDKLVLFKQEISKLRTDKENLRKQVHSVELSDFNSYLQRDSLMDEWSNISNQLQQKYIDAYGIIPTDTLLSQVSQEYNGYIFSSIRNKLTMEERQLKIVKNALEIYNKYLNIEDNYLNKSLTKNEFKDFSLLDTYKVSFSPLQVLKADPGKFLLVHFWGTWSSTCRDFDDTYSDKYDLFLNNGISIIGVNVDGDWNKFKAYSIRRKTPWKQYFDNETQLADAIQNEGVPLFALVNESGQIIAIIDNENVENVLNNTLAKIKQ